MYRLSKNESGVKTSNMYHFLSSDLTKLNLENWEGLYLNPTIKEKEDYVLVNEKVWTSLKNYYKGGPEIPFFLIDDSTKQEQFQIPRIQNFLFSQHYMYGYPDKDIKYLNLDFVVVDEHEQGSSVEQLRINYCLLVSYAMSFDQLIYYCATKLDINVDQLQLRLKMAGDIPVINFSDSKESISELFNYSENPKLDLVYCGNISKFKIQILV